jgi:L-fuconate dehydratase
MVKLKDIFVHDLRFPTSRTLDGSDAMNPAPDYSAAYVQIDSGQAGLVGCGYTFTIGRGNELCVAAIHALWPLVAGRSLDGITNDMAGFWRTLVGDSQLRWVGPEKGVIHLAAAAIVNAVWDLWAKTENKPVWKLVCDMSAQQLVSTIDFKGMTDAITPAEALAHIQSHDGGVAKREAHLLATGFPAYTTSAGWLGYTDEKLRSLCAQLVGAGWTALKVKVGRDLEDDQRRLAIIREAIGPNGKLMIDANQVWEVEEAITWTKALSPFDVAWIEEPIHPDDILGHKRVRDGVAPIRVATGEHAHNKIMFKQMLQAGAIDVVQLDACRLGGLNEALAVMLLAAKFSKPICPHAGGVGLCENAQHVSMIDYLRIGASQNGRMTEHAGHLHEHFEAPIEVKAGRYLVPSTPGFSAAMKPKSIADFSFPRGAFWRSAGAA